MGKTTRAASPTLGAARKIANTGNHHRQPNSTRAVKTGNLSVTFRSRVRGAASIVAALALEAQGDEARTLAHVAYELARIAAGLAVMA